MNYGDVELPERFWKKVYPCPVTGCWLWGAAVHDRLPYGIWRVSDRNERAHVSSFLASGGVLTEAEPFVLHSCDQPPCVRPEHLRSGDAGANMRDMVERKRVRLGRRTRLSVEDVVELRTRYAAGESTQALVDKFGISEPSISLITSGLRWRDAGGPFTFKRPLTGCPNPAGARPDCSAGHALTGDNLILKSNSNCRSGFERVCRTCRRKHNKTLSARRKAARRAKRETESQ